MQAWPCWHGPGEAVGGGRDGAAGDTSLEVLRGEACAQPTSAGQQSWEVPAALPGQKFMGRRNVCEVGAAATAG